MGLIDECKRGPLIRTVVTPDAVVTLRALHRVGNYFLGIWQQGLCMAGKNRKYIGFSVCNSRVVRIYV